MKIPIVLAALVALAAPSSAQGGQELPPDEVLLRLEEGVLKSGPRGPGGGRPGTAYARHAVLYSALRYYRPPREKEPEPPRPDREVEPRELPPWWQRPIERAVWFPGPDDFGSPASRRIAAARRAWSLTRR